MHSTIADCWDYKVQSVADVLRRWAAHTDRDPKRTYIWVCSLCLNQHRIINKLSPDELAAEFGPRVQQIGRILPMLEPCVPSMMLERDSHSVRAIE